MGRISHLTPAEFSRQFNAMLRQVVAAKGGASGRSVAGVSARWAGDNITGRKKDYWAKLFVDGAAMTTEDIALVAKWLGVSPFEFVRAVREDNIELLLAVGGSTHDDNVTEVDFTRSLPVIEEEIPDDKAAKTKRGPREDEGTDGPGSDSGS